MKAITLQAALSSAALLLLAQSAGATRSHHLAHNHYHAKKHTHTHQHKHRDPSEDGAATQKRGTCSLPSHPDLVYVPGAMNNGFALSPDEPPSNGKWCPFACVPGKVMNQWRPNTTYTYPESMDGGLECKDGEAVKPFPDQPYCVDGTNTLDGVNQCTKVLSFCQTVLPGNEAMLIPTEIQPGGTQGLAVPGPSYWASTAAHYYINPPGVGKEGCIWGDSSKPVGNWAPYVAGANTDQNGQTFVKIAWNPIYTDCPLGTVKPSYGVRIECPGGGCNGTPCEIDPSKVDINGVNSPVKAEGVGGANFCVVTVPKGKSANIVVFQTDGSKATSPASSPSKSPSAAAPSPPSTSSKPAPSTSSSSTHSSPAAASSSPSSSASWSAPSSSSSSSSSHPTVLPGIFHENSTYSTGVQGGSSPAATAPPKTGQTGAAAEPTPSPSKNEGAADQGGAAIAGLIVAIVAAAALY